MHELGLLYQTAETATRYAEENGIEEVRSIALEIGQLSGALPDLFTELFPMIAKRYPRLKNAELQLTMVQGEGLCMECRCLYNVMRQEGVCPRCGSRVKTVLGGRDVRLMNIGY